MENRLIIKKERRFWITLHTIKVD